VHMFAAIARNSEIQYVDHSVDVLKMKKRTNFYQGNMTENVYFAVKPKLAVLIGIIPLCFHLSIRIVSSVKTQLIYCQL
jgi:hypothetical protein